MKYTFLERLDSLALSILIGKARDAEFAGFKRVSESIETDLGRHSIDPDFSDYEDLQKADLFRLCGNFLSHCGKARNISFTRNAAKIYLPNQLVYFLNSI